MGVIFLALVTYGSVGPDEDIPVWVIIAAASAISLGTYSGGWRIMRTLGRRIIHLDPPRGFAAETTAASVLCDGDGLRRPISTTHCLAVMGVSPSALRGRWGVARSICRGWC
jgi:PiT family inorganic phosphate transporter